MRPSAPAGLSPPGWETERRSQPPSPPSPTDPRSRSSRSGASLAVFYPPLVHRVVSSHENPRPEGLDTQAHVGVGVERGPYELHPWGKIVQVHQLPAVASRAIPGLLEISTSRPGRAEGQRRDDQGQHQGEAHAHCFLLVPRNTLDRQGDTLLVGGPARQTSASRALADDRRLSCPSLRAATATVPHPMGGRKRWSGLAPGHQLSATDFRRALWTTDSDHSQALTRVCVNAK